MSKPKILIVDIETSPIEAYVWGLWDNNVALNQVKKDWQIISWAAKWLDQKKIYQMDQGHDTEETLLVTLRRLLDEADIVISQNGKKFDIPKIYARFILNGIKQPSSFQQIDTRKVAKKVFGFTSNSLEYMSDKLCLKYKKLKHQKFPGMELWTECLKGNRAAWKEMRRYNKWDVLTTEELYKKLAPWDTSINFNVYYGDKDAKCSCGGTEFSKNGYMYTSVGKYQRFECKNCGAELRSRQNLNKNKKMLVPARR